MEKTCSSSTSSHDYECGLPEDLIQEILVRVPVKSLLRFKSVCKDWKSMITKPCFGKSQFQHSNKTTQHISLSHILLRTDNTMFTLHLNLNNVYDKRTEGIKGNFVPISPTFEPSLDKTGFHIISSSNGLLCVHVRDTENMFLWNPTTNESRLIPSPIGTTFECLRKTYCGCGYVSSTNDYKILLAARYSRNHREPLQVKVYSLRENRWRQIDCIPSNQYIFCKTYRSCSGDAILLNNALHWVVENTYNTNTVFVVKFDLVKEVFQRTGKVKKIDRESEAIGSFSARCRLGLAIGDNGNEHLCICDMQHRRGKADGVEMWVIDERDYTMKRKFRLEGKWNKLGNDHRLLRITGYGKVVIFEKCLYEWRAQHTRLESLLVFDARQPQKPFYIRVTNEYCLPYKSGVPVYNVVDFVPTLLSPNS